MQRAYYQGDVAQFLGTSVDQLLGELAQAHSFDLDQRQLDAWIHQIEQLQVLLLACPDAHVFFEFTIPRMGKRADVVLILNGYIVIIEYKVGGAYYSSRDIDQALDYALDLHNFHEGSHEMPIVPILVATQAPSQDISLYFEDDVATPVLCNDDTLAAALQLVVEAPAHSTIDAEVWALSRYKPTPTIVEAAQALYRGHNVEEISRSDGGAINLARTGIAVEAIIEQAKANNRKAICFVTGVPGAGKTLGGLNIANSRMKAHEDEHAVFLSGNGPLVQVLREALARDEIARAKDHGDKITKKVAHQRASTFIQNIHHFRDDNLIYERAPVEKVAVFDEAQRAWNEEQTSSFMQNKRGQPGFAMSEPEFLLSVMDRHDDWCAVICLVGGGQEINTGVGGIGEWFKALEEQFTEWDIYCSDQLPQDYYEHKEALLGHRRVIRPSIETDLHLAVSMRSFRAEQVSTFVNAIIDGKADQAIAILQQLDYYPIALTRDRVVMQDWLKRQARGSERIGLVASSNALRLKPVGIHVKSDIDPPAWFLGEKGDVRASYALEDVATEFDIQGLELDWVGVCWDANFRREHDGWVPYQFRGSSWQSINGPDRQQYLANAYRVLLTRARQGMVIFVPYGDEDDPTRPPFFYDGIYEFLLRCGIPILDAQKTRF